MTPKVFPRIVALAAFTVFAGCDSNPTAPTAPAKPDAGAAAPAPAKAGKGAVNVGRTID